MTQSVLDNTQFLNVDLNIFSKSDLEPLVIAMGKKVSVNYVGREKRTYSAHMDLAIGNPKSPESAILQFCKLIRELPAEARELWNGAKSRSFDIGVESRGPMRYYWFSLAPKTIMAAAEISAQIAVTVYGPLKRAGVRSKSLKAVLST